MDTVRELNKKDVVYCCRILPTLDVFEINECTVRTVEDDYFVTTEKKTKEAYMFRWSECNKVVFKDRKDALKTVREAEKEYKKTKKRGRKNEVKSEI